eukprot:6847713-Alexandrium_andersonii.AAC.1
MSASLVGSEMCIRDRFLHPALMPPVNSQVNPRCSPGVRPSCASEFLEGAPVSYTHLTLPTICSV